MADIAVQPFIMRDCLFQVESDNYEAHVSQVEFVPSSSTVRFKGLTPAANFPFGTVAEWVATLAYAQDWATEDSLSRYLHENEGATIDVEFTPVNGGPNVTATLTVTPGSIGGTVDAVAVATVSLGSTKPVVGAAVSNEPTGVTPDAPGAFTPGGSTVPKTLAKLTLLGDLGETTAWSAGQFVVLGDLSTAHWSGTAWVAGPKPA